MTSSTSVTNKTAIKHDVFVAEYAKDCNGRRAAIAAGYSEKTAAQAASRLLKNVNISEAIQAEKKDRIKRLAIDADTIKLRLFELAFVDTAAIYHQDGTVKPISDWPPGAINALSGFEVVETTDKNGMPVGYLKKIKLVCPLAATKALGDHKDVSAFRVNVQLSALEQLTPWDELIDDDIGVDEFDGHSDEFLVGET